MGKDDNENEINPLHPTMSMRALEELYEAEAIKAVENLIKQGVKLDPTLAISLQDRHRV